VSLDVMPTSSRRPPATVVMPRRQTIMLKPWEKAVRVTHHLDDSFGETSVVPVDG